MLSGERLCFDDSHLVSGLLGIHLVAHDYHLNLIWPCFFDFVNPLLKVGERVFVADVIHENDGMRVSHVHAMQCPFMFRVKSTLLS